MARIELPLWVMVIAGWLLLLRLPDRRGLVRLLTVAAVAWAAEQTLLRAHGYHFYSSEWLVVAGAVPLVLPMWWALAIVTAYDVTEHASDPRYAAAFAGLLVLADAAILQPWLVSVGGCRWNGAGPFGVAPIGIVAPAIIAYASGGVLRRADRGPWQSVVVDGFAAVGTVHLAVLGAWHVGLKFLEGPWPAVATALVAVAIAALSAAIVWTRPGRARRRFGVVRTFGVGPMFGGLAARGAASAQWAWTAALFVPSLVARTRPSDVDNGSSK